MRGDDADRRLGHACFVGDGGGGGGAGVDDAVVVGVRMGEGAEQREGAYGAGWRALVRLTLDREF